MSHSAHVAALQARHSALSRKIETEQSRPGADGWLLKNLKRQRLRVKEQIEGVAG